MKVVEFGKKWIVRNADEYLKAIEELEGSEFLTDMTENFYQYRTEKAEINRQRADLHRQAVALGIA